MSLANWWTDLEAEAVKEFDAVVAGVEAEAKLIADAIGPVIITDVENFLNSIVQIAVGAVMQQAPLVMSGAEKFGAAVASVIQQVEAQGKTIVLGDAHMVVQAAYHAVQVAVNKPKA